MESKSELIGTMVSHKNVNMVEAGEEAKLELKLVINNLEDSMTMKK